MTTIIGTYKKAAAEETERWEDLKETTPYYEEETAAPGRRQTKKTHPYDVEEYTEYEKDVPESVGPKKPSDEARLMTFKHRLNRYFGKERLSGLDDDDFKDLMDEFGLVELTPGAWDAGAELEDAIDKKLDSKGYIQAKPELEKRMQEGRCISCGEDTGPEHSFETGGKIVSPPVCATCSQLNLHPYVDRFLDENFEKEDIDKNINKFYEVPTDPSVIEENVAGDVFRDDTDWELWGNEDYDPGDTMPVPGDDDYDPAAAEKAWHAQNVLSSLVPSLVKLANDLDSKGHFEEASELDEIAKHMLKG